jgi:penicillin-binding protein 1A
MYVQTRLLEEPPQSPKKQRRCCPKSRCGKVLLSGFLLLFVLGLTGGGIAAYYVHDVWTRTPDISTLQERDAGKSSLVYAADGSRLGYIHSDTLRFPVDFEQVPTYLRQATVAIEDRRFYEHDGVDWKGVARALYRDVRSRQKREGASTLTMQLVRNLYISNEKSISRKIAEAKLAREMEKQHSKRWILWKYLNNVPYGTAGGQELIGVQAASRAYFDKPVEKLTLAETALLAGLPQSPSLDNPFVSKENARQRRNEVLDAMERSGYITPSEAEKAKAKKVRVRPNDFYNQKAESYVFDYVRQQLINRFGEEKVRSGGLKVYTTIQPSLQRKARAAIAGQLGQKGDPAAAIVSIDAQTGYIKTMVSSTSYSQSKFNLATQGRRQPGSTFKPFVLLTAMRKHQANPETTYYNSRPLDFTDPVYGPIKVATDDDRYYGAVNLSESLIHSDNSVYQQLTLDVTPQSVRATARSMGITSKLEANPAIGLGGLKTGVSPLEMTSAYATLANRGTYVKPVIVRKVSFPDGSSKRLYRERKHRSFSTGVAKVVTDILQENVKRGTGTKAQMKCPAAGKTGTTDNFKDAWFAGYTPDTATVVWVGYPGKSTPMTNVHGITVFGGTFPAGIWHDYMQEAVVDCKSFIGNRASSLHTYCSKYSTCAGQQPYEPVPQQDLQVIQPTTPVTTP